MAHDVLLARSGGPASCPSNPCAASFTALSLPHLSHSCTEGWPGYSQSQVPTEGLQHLGTEDVGLLPTQHPLLRDALGHTVPNLQEKKQTWEQKDLPKILQSNLAQLGPPAFILTS